MQGDSFEEAVQGVSSSMGKVSPETVAADVFHFMLVRQRGNGALRIFSAERLVQEDKVGESATNLDCGLLEGDEVGL